MNISQFSNSPISVVYALDMYINFSILGDKINLFNDYFQTFFEYFFNKFSVLFFSWRWLNILFSRTTRKAVISKSSKKLTFSQIFNKIPFFAYCTANFKG